MRSTVHFSQIKHTAKRRVTCEECGRKVNRQRAFVQTVNPMNKNADGTVKSFLEVMAAVRVQAFLWEPPADCGRHLAEVDPAGGAM